MTTDRISTILVPTDFSDNAAVALDRAIEIATHHESDILLLHALDAAVSTTWTLELQRRIAECLAAAETRVRSRGLQSTSEFVRGRPWEKVAEIEKTIQPDLIVIGARGHGVFPHLVGTVADRILRIASAPVLTVHPHDVGGSEGFRSVVAAIDFTEESLYALDTALTLMKPMKGPRRLSLVSAWQPLVHYDYGPMPSTIATEMEESGDAAEMRLNELAAALRGDNLDVQCTVRIGHPAAVIRDEAESLGAGLIALGTHGRKGIERFMLGSVAERVVHHAPCPVLTTRMARAAKAAGDGREKHAHA